MYTFSKPNLITAPFTLPSNGKLYGPNFDPNITLRAMTTLEERMRLGSQSYYESMSAIVNECIVGNKNPDGTYKIDSRYLTLFDFDAICVKLRILTYGSKYKASARCLKCGKNFLHILDLCECEFTFVPDDFQEPFDIGPLPISGDTLGCRFLRVQDRIDIMTKTQNFLAKNPNFVGEASYTFEMEHRIMSVNGEDIDSIMVPRYVESMIGGDSSYYHRKMDEVDSGKFFGTEKFGVKRIYMIDCEDHENAVHPCDGLAICAIRGDDEFFRTPDID